MALSRLQRASLVWGQGHRPEDLAEYGFTTGERSPTESSQLMSFTWLAEKVHPRLNSRQARVLTLDKWVFYRWMAGFGLPVPRTLGLYDPLHGVSWDGARRMRTAAEVVAEVSAARLPGLVLKPTGGEQGLGLLILDDVDHATGAATTREGVRTTLEEAVASVDVAGMGGHPGYVVQEPVPSHPEYRDLAPWTTNTIRVITIVDRDGEAHVQAAATLLGRRGRMANNFHAGGVNVGVDVETGALGRGRVLGRAGWVDEHPDTGVPFAGRSVPDWDEVTRVCRHAATLLPGLRSIGWDVVVTPDGPVLLEANDGWGMRMVQLHGPGFLADERVRAQFQAAGVPLPSGSRWSGVAPVARRTLRPLVKRLRG